jgi:copper resistance protein B
MKLIKSFIILGLIGSLSNAYAMAEDDPLIAMVLIDQLETRITDGANPTVLEADAWLGYDLHKLWFKVDAEKVGSQLEESEFQMLYSRAIDPYWDLQIGWRHNNKPKPSRDWLALGFKGLAPYWIETDAALFINDDSQVNARLTLEYEMMLTQQWVLIPELGMNFFSKKDDEAEIGSGLSDMSFGLRLGYEIKREFAPYIGVNWSKKFGGTADHAREEGEDVSDTQFVVGIRAWF